MPQITATVRQPVIDTINEMAKKEKRSFSEMVAVLLEKVVYVDHVVTIRGKDLILPIERAGSSNLRGDQSSDPVQQ